MAADSTLDDSQKKYALNALFFKRMYRLMKPYWTRKRAWKSWLILAILVFSSVGFSLLGGYLSNLTADTTNALVDKKPFYWHLMIWMTFIGTLQGVANITTGFIGSKLLMDWREWLTNRLMEDYLARRTYYEIQKDDRIDNPDQRIQEEVLPFCQTIIGLPQFILSSLSTIGVQSFILINISTSMFWAVLIYAVFNSVVTWWLYHPTIKQNWDLTMRNAELRSALMNLRNNAENIAFYRGERCERRRVEGYLGRLAKIKMKIIFYNQRISAVNEFTGLIFTLLPVIFVVPLYFQGQYEYGTIDQSIMAASMMMSGLSIINNFIPTMASVVPKAVRLAEIQEKLDTLKAPQPDDDTPRIRVSESRTIHLERVDLYTPGGEQHLVTALSLTIEPGQHTVVVGQTGIGKSSLLRALAGLWHRGSGELGMPALDQLMFVPQRPYMLLSDLRSQLLYPRVDAPLEDEAFQRVFERLGRPDFIALQGGLDAVKDWRRILSLGEQQLVAFARILLRKPVYVFIDEGTSALDLHTEERVYRCLAGLGTTFISVGHRKSILKFHHQTLQMLPDGHWRVFQTPPLSHLGEIDTATGSV